MSRSEPKLTSGLASGSQGLERTGAFAGRFTNIRSVPFLNDGASELLRYLDTRALKTLSFCGGTPLYLNARSAKDGFSGVALHLFMVPATADDEAWLEMTMFEDHNPVPLRTARQALLSDTGLFIEPFLFDPVAGSEGKTYNIVIQSSSKLKEVKVLCSASGDATTAVGHRRYKGLQPIVIPYHSLTVSENAALSRTGNPRVSVLIVTYNNEHHAKRCLDSVLTQDYPDIEVVVIDNNSRDRTVDIIRESYGHIKLQALKDNLGYCKANNLGLDLCTGGLIFVLNPDTCLLSGTVTHLVDEISASPHIAVVGPLIETKKSMTRYASAFLVGRQIGSAERHLGTGTRFMAAPCGTGFLIRRSTIERLGYLFDEGFVSDWEDHDLGLRCWLHGYVCIHTPYLGIYHDGAGSFGVRNPQRNARIMKNSLLTYFKNYKMRPFLRAFLRTVLACRSWHGLLGVIRFFWSSWRYVPARAALQRVRKLSDNDMMLLACGMHAIIAGDPQRDTQNAQ